MNTSVKKINITTVVKELENITHEFENEEIDLEQSIPKFKKAMELAKYIKHRLTRVENEVEKIINDYQDDSVADKTETNSNKDDATE